MKTKSKPQSFDEHVEDLQCKYTVRYGLPPVRELPVGTVIGLSAYTNEALKLRWLDPKSLVAENITASDAARCFLKASYKLPVRRRRDQLHTAARLPLLVRRGRYADAAYVDIKSTYKGVVEAFGYDVEYRRNGYLSANPHPTPLPPLVRENKRAYAAIVALAASPVSVMQRWTGEKVETFRATNVYSQPCLWSLTRDILLAVYSQMFMEFTLRYVNTDGYILDARHADAAKALLESWGFASSVKGRGAAVIHGVGSYSIGSVRTAREAHSENFATLPMAFWSVRWLKRRVAARLAAAYGLQHS